jgi:hypothetical protein
MELDRHTVGDDGTTLIFITIVAVKLGYMEITYCMIPEI